MFKKDGTLEILNGKAETRNMSVSGMPFQRNSPALEKISKGKDLTKNPLRPKHFQHFQP